MSISFYTLWFLMSEQNLLQKYTITNKQDIYYVLLFTIVVWIVKNILLKTIKPLVAEHFICHARYDSLSLQHKRATTITKYIIDFVFYLFTSIYAYSLLQHSCYLPRWFLGQHPSPNSTNVFTWDSGFYEDSLRTFMQIQLAIHSHALFNHITVNLYESKYYEFLLHHGLAFFLLVFSFYCNCWKGASLVLFLHDLSDVFLLQVRIYADYKTRNKTLTNVLFVFNVLFWFHSRLIFFPIYIIIPCFYAVQYGLYSPIQHFPAQ